MSGRVPRVYNTECVVLARRNIGEADSILTVFSPELGRFDAVARGVRKARSHMRGHLEPLTRVRVLLAHGRSLDVFSQAEAVAVYRQVHEDLDRYAAAVYGAELVRRIAPEHEPLPWLYRLLVGLLEVLDEGGRLSVLRGFESRVLDGAGFAVQVAGCAACGKRLPEEDGFFSAVGGGLICADCRRGGESGRPLSLRAIKVLRFAERATLDEFAALAMDEGLEREVESALADALRQTLDAEPRSGQFVHEVRALYRPGSAPQGSEPDVARPHVQ